MIQLREFIGIFLIDQRPTNICITMIPRNIIHPRDVERIKLLCTPGKLKQNELTSLSRVFFKVLEGSLFSRSTVIFCLGRNMKIIQCHPQAWYSKPTYLVTPCLISMMAHPYLYLHLLVLYNMTFMLLISSFNYYYYSLRNKVTRILKLHLQKFQIHLFTSPTIAYFKLRGVKISRKI